MRDASGTLLATGARHPFFAPDGESIGFHDTSPLVGSAIMRVPVGGGTPRTVASLDFALSPRGIEWTEQGFIVFGTRRGGIYRVSAEGGEPTAITTLREGELVHRMA